MKKQIPNMITGIRIVCSVIMMFFPVFSLGFYAMHFICAISDALDGHLARKMHCTSVFGEKFDSVSDMIFIMVLLAKLLPEFLIVPKLLVWILCIAVIKITNIILGVIYRKNLVFLHTPMNRITGFIIFFMPFTMYFFDMKYSLIPACILATISAIQEGYYICVKSCGINK